MSALPSRSRRVVVTWVLATCVAVTATVVAPVPGGAAAGDGTAWRPLPAFDAHVEWSDCGDGWVCGTLAVPVDWREPMGETVGLALIRRPASAPAERRGTLVVNPGGPGAAGTSYLRAAVRRLPAVVQDRFDLVSWDPRGTGASRPVDCVDDAFLDLGAALPVVPDTAESLATTRRYYRAFARGCAERTGNFARHVGTRNSARDLEAIRIALGEPAVNYLGFSYGTILGMTYAQMFPSSFRAMVLDAPPDYWLPQLDYAYAQAEGFILAFDAFIGWCEADASCALRAIGSPRELFTSLLDALSAAPMSAGYTANGVTRTGVLTANLFATAVISMLYDRARGWPILGRALAAGASGDHGLLLALADAYLGRAPDGTWSALVESNSVISCVDRPEPMRRRAAQELADVARFQAALPPWGGGWAVSTCTGMPKPARGGRLGDVHVRGAAPILVVGTTGDPATPYAGSRAVVSRIEGAALLTYESTEHTAYGTGRSTCVDDAVNAYLLDGVVPPPETRCLPD